MKRFDQINVIPFIDIMLVLLAIVLTTATFISQEAIEVDLPGAESAESLQESDEDTLKITINRDNKVFIDDQSVTNQELAMKLETLGKETPILLRVDKTVAFEYFVNVIDLLKKNKLKKLSIVTQEAHEK